MVQNCTDASRGIGYGDSMELTAGGCYEIDGQTIRRVEDPVGTAGPTRWQERQRDLDMAAYAMIHEHRHLTAEEIGLYEAMRSELQHVRTAIAAAEGESVPAVG